MCEKVRSNLSLIAEENEVVAKKSAAARSACVDRCMSKTYYFAATTRRNSCLLGCNRL